MEYVYSYELCALLFLFIVVGVFFSKKQFPTTANKFFAVIVICGFAHISLDMLSAWMIEHVMDISFVYVQTVCATFYSLQMMFPLGLLYYVSLIAGWKGKARNISHWLLIVPCFMLQAALSTNPWTELFFYVDPVTEYTRGPWFNLFYIMTAIYLILTVVAVFVFRKSLKPLQIATVLSAIVVIVAAVSIQYAFPEYLLTGVAVAICIVMMYLIIQNPEDMLDAVTGIFNKEALDVFMSTQVLKKKEYGIIVFDAPELLKIGSFLGAEAVKELACKIGDFLTAMAGKDAWVFRESNNVFLIVLKNDDKFEEVYSKIYETCKGNNIWKVRDEELVLDIHLTRVREIGEISNIENLMMIINENIPSHSANTEVYSIDLDSEAISLVNRKIKIEDALTRGLSEGNFEIYYQPIFSTKDQKFTHAEALLRITDPELGEISPSEFIPIAENCGLIFEIDEMVISNVCKFIAKHDINSEFGLKQIEVNISGAEFIRKDLAETISEVIDSYSVNAEQICIELTETVATTSFDSFRESAREMRRKGFTFALDDYGTGYANISQLARLKFEIVKIDRSMLVAHFENEKSAIIFEYIVNMLKSLGLTVVVEGAEEQDQIDLLTNLEVDLIQGYYYSRPLRESDFKKFLMKYNF